jgi:hypothetical protein
MTYTTARLFVQTVMVHTWISLRADTLGDHCLNRSVCRIFKDESTYFYGDYDLDVFLGTKHDYADLSAVVEKVVGSARGWVSRCGLSSKVPGAYTSLDAILGEFGNISHSQIHKLLPRKEKRGVVQSWIYRKDGNFTLIACETEKFYYVFCFATS